MPKWIESVRSIVAVLLVASFCFIAIWMTMKNKLTVDGKDFVYLVSLVVVFYFALKDRTQPSGAETITHSSETVDTKTLVANPPEEKKLEVKT